MRGREGGREEEIKGGRDGGMKGGWEVVEDIYKAHRTFLSSLSYLFCEVGIEKNDKCIENK